MKKRRIWLLISVMIFGLLISACAAAKNAEDSVSYVMPAEEGFYETNYDEGIMEEEAVESDRQYSSGTGSSASEVERMVIYNASMEIAVEDPAGAMDSVVEMAEMAGGFVVSSNIYQSTSSSGETLQHAYVTVRVPAGDLESIMSAIKALTPVPDEDVISEYVTGQDVTSEYTDLSSRLRNLEAAEAELLEIMEAAQDTEDVLDVFDELTYYRGEIEIVKGRMQYLEESAALSSITVDIVAKESLQPIAIGGWEPQGTVKKAVEALISAGQFLVDALIWIGIFCLPFLIPLGLAIFFLIKLIKKQKAKKKARKMELLGEQPDAGVQKPETK